ncbi:MAG: hypothetical protein IPG71_14090 [bacterium]|nr:hypothetical protein [bacterium]
MRLLLRLMLLIFVAGNTLANDLIVLRDDPVDSTLLGPNSYSWINPDFEDYLERVETGTWEPLRSLIRPTLQHEHYVRLRPYLDDSHPERFFLSEPGRYRSEFIVRTKLLNATLRRSHVVEQDTSGRHRWPKLLGELFWDGQNLYSYCRRYPDTLAFSVQPVYGFERIGTDDERGALSRFTGGFRVEAGYDRKLYGMVDFRDHTESGNGPYFTRAALYEDRWASIDLKGNGSTSYDVSESVIRYYGKHLSASAGRGRHKWGPGYFGSLLLNNYAPPFDYARFDAQFGTIGYVFLHGFLKSLEISDSLYINPDGRPRTLDAQKYLSAQRIELAPRNNVRMAFSQAVIYGDRGLQLGYLTPLNFLYSVQHSNDDKDNLLLSLDGKWRPTPGLKFYGELLLDDVLVSDLFTGSGSTKNAYTLGAHGKYPHGVLGPFDARIEYTKIRPFVYSHFFSVNTYSHWTSPLGYTRRAE